MLIYDNSILQFSKKVKFGNHDRFLSQHEFNPNMLVTWWGWIWNSI